MGLGVGVRPEEIFVTGFGAAICLAACGVFYCGVRLILLGIIGK
jgi:hypothetical protein